MSNVAVPQGFALEALASKLHVSGKVAVWRGLGEAAMCSFLVKKWHQTRLPAQSLVMTVLYTQRRA